MKLIGKLQMAQQLATLLARLLVVKIANQLGIELATEIF